MAMTTFAPNSVETVVLHGGLVASLASLRALWSLEDRGFHVRLDGDELVVSPGSRLTSEDCRLIRQLRDELVALVRLSGSIQ